jgi:hypothetical protein
LDKRTWTEGMYSDWLMFPSMWGIAAAVAGDGALSLQQFMDILGECHPNLKPRMPFFLLAAVDRFVAENDSRIHAQLLRALESLKDAEVDRVWLKSSNEFVRDSMSLSTPFDLLIRSLRSLDRLEKVAGIDSAPVSSVREYLHKLKTIRDRAVPAQEPRSKE